MLTIDNPSKFDWANMDLGECMEGNAMDTHFTLKLFDLIVDRLEDNTMNLLKHVVMPSLSNFAEMEWEGLIVDQDALDRVGRQLSSKNMDREDGFAPTLKLLLEHIDEELERRG